MRRFLTAILAGSVLVLFCIFTSGTPSLAVDSTTPKLQAGTVTGGGDVAKPLIKCSTCGVEFTTIKQAEEHLKTHPEHKLTSISGESAKPLIKCSTCGVEFTTIKQAEEHLKTHPEHKLAPE